MMKRILTLTASCLLLCQCNTLKSDCEAVAQREQEIASEARGDYYIGRRYYIPHTRFWGYLREPGQSWRTARLVIMDESLCRNPDRGYEPPVKGATFGHDQNVEYMVCGSYTDETAYDPSTNLILPVFQVSSFTVRDKDPGFLFKPSEEYSKSNVTLRPAIMPKPHECLQFARP